MIGYVTSSVPAMTATTPDRPAPTSFALRAGAPPDAIRWAGVAAASLAEVSRDRYRSSRCRARHPRRIGRADAVAPFGPDRHVARARSSLVDQSTQRLDTQSMAVAAPTGSVLSAPARKR
jgi:hypothetical protein